MKKKLNLSTLNFEGEKIACLYLYNANDRDFSDCNKDKQKFELAGLKPKKLNSPECQLPVPLPSRGMSLVQKCGTQIKSWEDRGSVAGSGEGGGSDGGCTGGRRPSASAAHHPSARPPALRQRPARGSGEVLTEGLPAWLVFLLNG